MDARGGRGSRREIRLPRGPRSAAARNAIDTIRSAVRNLSASAGRWPVVDDMPYRKCKVGKFVILYKPLASERLEVSRIHHTRQNWR